MLVIETNIDDMNPEFYDYVFDRLFAAGARDVFLSPIQMKKNRPGHIAPCHCRAEGSRRAGANYSERDLDHRRPLLSRRSDHPQAQIRKA